MKSRYCIAIAHTKNGHKAVAVDTQYSAVLNAAIEVKDSERVDLYKNGHLVKHINPAGQRATQAARAKQAAARERLAKRSENQAEKQAANDQAEAGSQGEPDATENKVEAPASKKENGKGKAGKADKRVEESEQTDGAGGLTD